MATRVRYQIILATTLAAVMLYLDRVCIAEIAKLDEFRDSLGLTETQTGSIMSAFFFTYALSQVQPAGCPIALALGSCCRFTSAFGRYARWRLGWRPVSRCSWRFV